MPKTVERGTLFVDLDGTVIDSNTNKFLPGAVDYFSAAQRDGWRIIITTYRGENWPIEHVFGVNATLNQLDTAGFKYDGIVWDSPSPRVLINDAVAQAIQHTPNKEWGEYHAEA